MGEQWCRALEKINPVEPESKSFVVIELTEGLASDQVVGQLLRHTGSQAHLRAGNDARDRCSLPRCRLLQGVFRTFTGFMDVGPSRKAAKLDI